MWAEQALGPLATCPKPVTGEDLAGIFAASIQLW